MFTGKMRSTAGRRRTIQLAKHQCDECSKKFELSLKLHSRNKKQKHSFCSRQCSYVFQKKRIGPNHHLWKGGRRPNKAMGYVEITVAIGYPGSHIKQGKNGPCSTASIIEHRYVMQEALGRPLLSIEQVHHKNGIKDDNRIDNLELRSGSHGAGATSYTEDVNRLLAENNKLKNMLADLLAQKKG